MKHAVLIITLLMAIMAIFAHFFFGSRGSDVSEKEPFRLLLNKPMQSTRPMKLVSNVSGYRCKKDVTLIENFQKLEGMKLIREIPIGTLIFFSKVYQTKRNGKSLFFLIGTEHSVARKAGQKFVYHWDGNGDVF